MSWKSQPSHFSHTQPEPLLFPAAYCIILLGAFFQARELSVGKWFEFTAAINNLIQRLILKEGDAGDSGVERARGAVEQATERLLQRLLCTVADLDARFSSKFLATLASKTQRAENVSFFWCCWFTGYFITPSVSKQPRQASALYYLLFLRCL
jgi:hypothetical protein